MTSSRKGSLPVFGPGCGRFGPGWSNQGDRPEKAVFAGCVQVVQVVQVKIKGIGQQAETTEYAPAGRAARSFMSTRSTWPTWTAPDLIPEQAASRARAVPGPDLPAPTLPAPRSGRRDCRVTAVTP